MIRTLRLLTLGFTLAIAACGGTASADLIPPPLTWESSTLSIETDTGAHPFEVEVADDDAERERGLMYRTDLAPNEGMIFDYGHERMVTMWMKNTPLSLDMVFISSNGRVSGIAERTTPYSLELISSREPVRAVLELNAGTVNRIGLKRGDVVRARMFGNAP